MLRSSALLGAALAVAAGCQRPASPRTDAHPHANAAPAADALLTIVATAEIRGTPEPCGCQSDPLGDVARVATLLTEARVKGGVLLVDAGGLRYNAVPLSPAQRPQARLKAEFLEQQWSALGSVTGLGDEDLSNADADALTALAAARLASNVSWVRAAGATPAKGGEVREVAGVKVGVFAVVDKARLEAAAKESAAAVGGAARLEVGDPVAAAQREVAALKGRGAQVVVALCHMSRADVRRLVRAAPGITMAVAGDEVGEAGGEAERVGETIVVQPAEQAMKVARVELHVRAGLVSTELFAGTDERDRELKRLGRKLEQTGKDVERLAADPQADPTFVAAKRAEKERIAAEIVRVKDGPVTPPSGSYALAELVPIRRRINRDPALAGAMKALDARIGETNRKAAENVPPPPAGKGEARYVGTDDCELCHAKAVKLWNGTVHEKAWEELVHVDKQWSYDCISCHVTGYGRAGGSSMAHVDHLEDVQCEVCHGPASLHVAKPKKFHLGSPTEADCKVCHTPEHSDTFNFTAYLRDILGPGHGEQKRAKLGEGPTGHELRHGAIEKANQM